jgi:transcription elongation factor GreA
MTREGYENLMVQLNRMQNSEMIEIATRIADARALGDLSENAEYHAAREQQSFIEGRIAALDSLLAEAQVIEVANIDVAPRIVFGATIRLINLNNETEVTYQIVGEEEADINQGLISVGSPIARALIRKEQHDVVQVNAPGGVVEYEILEVKYI